MSQVMDLLIERVNNPKLVENFMKEVRKASLDKKDLERYEKFNRDVNEFFKEHPEYKQY